MEVRAAHTSLSILSLSLRFESSDSLSFLDKIRWLGFTTLHDLRRDTIHLLSSEISISFIPGGRSIFAAPLA